MHEYYIHVLFKILLISFLVFFFFYVHFNRVSERGGGGAAHSSVHHTVQPDSTGGEHTHTLTWTQKDLSFVIRSKHVIWRAVVQTTLRLHLMFENQKTAIQRFLIVSWIIQTGFVSHVEV